MQVDVGFGDAVTPAALEVDYPSLLDMPMPRLRAYPPETIVAEKLQAMVALGMLNSRMKDFFDLWAISQTFPFDGPVLGDALRATFTRRGTLLPAGTPIALTQAFADDAAKQAQWRAFIPARPSRSLLSRFPICCVAWLTSRCRRSWRSER